MLGEKHEKSGGEVVAKSPPTGSQSPFRAGPRPRALSCCVSAHVAATSRMASQLQLLFRPLWGGAVVPSPRPFVLLWHEMRELQAGSDHRSRILDLSVRGAYLKW